MFKIKKNFNKIGPWYHSFIDLGINNKQKEGYFSLNQKIKEGIILSHLRLSIEKVKALKKDISVLELFSTDCYYAFYAVKFGATKVDAVDRDDIALQQAKMLINHWDIANKIKTHKMDVFEYKGSDCDIVLCCGGLYHISDPQKLIKQIKNNQNPRFLIVQTAASLKYLFDEKEYFESPAPGWTWGCRFNKSYFDRVAEESGFKIIDFSFNELTGNDREEDRGSMYYLLESKN